MSLQSSSLGAVLAGAVLLLSLCPSSLPEQLARGQQHAAPERPIQHIPLAGPISHPSSEISGLAWYDDHLIILPQHPSRFNQEDAGAVFAIPRSELAAALSERSDTPITPTPIPLEVPGFDRHIPYFQGYEAIAFHGDRVFVSIEATTEAKAQGYLLDGRIDADLSRLRLDPSRAVLLPPQAQLPNIAYEALLVASDTLAALYEVNGVNVNPRARAHLFDLSLQPLQAVPFPAIEYRITDATAPDGRHRFWTINYFFPGDRQQLQPAVDSLARTFGSGRTHRRSDTVERLVEFRLTPQGVRRTATPPLLLELWGDDRPRNWEGLARFEDRGFLIATDEYPETILAFVPTQAPDEEPPR